jgi:hypothetical protein
MRQQSKGDGSVSLRISFISAAMTDGGLSFHFEATQSRLFFVSPFLLCYSVSLYVVLVFSFSGPASIVSFHTVPNQGEGRR